MTREEAINQLKDFIILHREQHGWDVSTLDALDMAIKALEHEPCGDCISRQAVLDIAKTSKSNWIDNSVLFKRVSELLSVEPERKVGKWHVEGFDAWCTNCGFHPTTIEAFDYCPSCGAKMEVNEW